MLRDTPVLILAGGLGTRLQPALPGVPKGLAAVGDRPFLQIQIELLRDHGARFFVLCVGHRADQIRAALGDGSGLGVHIAYSQEVGMLLGTAGALRHAGAWLQPRALLLNGDTYLDVDYARLLEQHEHRALRHGALATIALARAPHGARFGTAILSEDQGQLVGFREKDAEVTTGARWLNAGAYVIERGLLSFIPEDRPSSLEREVFPAAIAAGRCLAAACHDVPFYDIGTPGDWADFARRFDRELRRRVA